MQQRAPQPKFSKPPPKSDRFWRSPTLALALAGGLLLWLSFPPLDVTARLESVADVAGLIAGGGG